jgi:hypothetical protein
MLLLCVIFATLTEFLSGLNKALSSGCKNLAVPGMARIL